MSTATATTGITITVRTEIQQALDAFKQLVDGGTKMLSGFEQKQAAISAATTAANLQRQKDFLAQVNKLVLAATGQRLKLLQLEEQEAVAQAARVLTETKDFEEAKLKIKTAYHARAMQLLEQEAAAEVTTSGASVVGGGGDGGLRRMAFQQLSHVGRASISSIVAGINPLMVLQFEAPRIIEASIGLAGGFQNLLAIIGPAAAGVAALGTVALATKAGLEAMKARAQESDARQALLTQTYDMNVKIADVIKRNVDLLGKDYAAELQHKLNQAAQLTAAQQRELEAMKNPPASQPVAAFPYGVPGQVPGLTEEQLAARRQAMIAENIRAAQEEIRAQLQGKIATDQQRAAAQQLGDTLYDVHVKSLDGYNQERIAANAAYRETVRNLDEQQKAAGQLGKALDVQRAKEEAHATLEAKLAEIQKKYFGTGSDGVVKFIGDLEDLSREFEKLYRQQEQARQQQRQNVAGDWRLTDAEKYRQIAALSTPQEQTKLGPDPGSFAQNIYAGMVQLQNQIGTFSQASAGLITNGVGAAFRGVSDSIMGMIDGTRTWGETFAGVAHGIIANVIELVVQWIEEMTIIAALKKLFGQKDNEQAAQSAAAWAPAAIAASIASYGTASAIGLGAFLAAASSGTAIAAGMAGVSAREFGGPVEAGRAYIVGEKRPELFVPGASGFIHPSVPAAMISSNSRGTDPTTSGNGVHVVNVFSERELTRYLQSHMAEQVIVNHITKNRSDLGFPT